MKRAPDFDRLARPYRWMERITFGSSLWRCRCAFLSKLTTCRNALILGDGDGRFIHALLAENPHVVIDSLDASEEMLREQLRNAGQGSGRIRMHRADARLWDPADNRYDLIVTHFFLDCLTTKEVTKLATRLKSSLKPEGIWVLSEFAVPRSLFGWLVAFPLVTALYAAFDILTGLNVHHLPNHRKALARAGFSLAVRQSSLRGLLVSEIWRPQPAHTSDKVFA